MSDLGAHMDFFTPSGCLTAEALKNYHSGDLPLEIKERIKLHLDDCEFCSDALDGLKLLSDPDKLDSIVFEINENLKSTLDKAETTQTGKSKLKTVYVYLAAAASVIILFGLYFYLQNYLPQKSTELSVSQVIELKEKTIPPMPKVKQNRISTTLEIAEEELSKDIEEVVLAEPVLVEETTVVMDVEEDLEIVLEKVAEKEITYVAPLKATRTSGSISKSFGNNIATEIPEAIEEEEYNSVDIASTQPLEYYIGGVVVYDRTMDEVQPAAFAERPALISGSRSKSKKSTGKPHVSKSTSAKEEAGADYSISPEERKYGNQEDLTGETHFFSLGNEVPQYPGGYEALMKYLNDNLSYPREAREQRIQGQLVISFLVGESGKVSNISIVHSLGGGCDEEVIRVIEKMPDWEPAFQENKPVRVMFNMPITFKLR